MPSFYDDEEEEFNIPWSSLSSLIQKVVIASGVTSISEETFRFYSNLTDVSISNTVKSINRSAFEGCDELISVTIPDSVISIGDYAFADCYSLENVTIPDSVTSIGDYAFAYCYNLEDVTVSDKSTFPSNAFWYTPWWNANAPKSGTFGEALTWNLDDDGTLTIDGTGEMPDFDPGDQPWYAFRDTVTNLVIESDVTSIGAYAFYCFDNLTSAVIPDSVLTIGNKAFADCYSLENVTLSGTPSFPSNAFWYTPWWNANAPKSGTFGENLSWNLADDGTLTISGTGEMPDFYYDDQPWYVYRDLVTNVVISSGVTTVGEYTFYSCGNLTSASISNTVTKIGYSAFEWCSNLSDLSLTNGLDSIEGDAFQECDSLTSVVIPNGVTTIGYNAFYSCDNLSSVVIPDSVTSIGDYAFAYCFKLSSVTLPDPQPEMGEAVFHETAWFRVSNAQVTGTLTEGEQDVAVPAGTTIYQKFVPSESGTYYIYSTGSIDSYGLLCDDEWVELCDADDNYTNMNFLISYTLTAGKTYYVGLSTYQGEDSTVHTVISRQAPEEYEEPSNEKLVSGTLTEGENKLSIKVNSRTNYAFTPEESGTYYIYSVSHKGIEGYLFDENWAELAYDEDGFEAIEEDSRNFLISYDLSAGKTYYIGAEYYTDAYDSDTLDIAIVITQTKPTKAPKSLSDYTLTLDQDSYVYDGKAKTPAVTVKDGDRELIAGTDYDVAYDHNTDAGTATVTATGQGSYIGSIEKTFTIEKADQTVTAKLSPVEIKVGQTANITAKGTGALTYASGNKKIATVSQDGVVTGVSEGKANLTVTAAGDANTNSGTTTVSVTVTKSLVDLSACTVTLAANSFPYSGAAMTPAVTVKNGKTTLTAGTDYTVTYAKNINAGTATVTVTGQGNYTGSVDQPFTITKASATITAKNVTKTYSTKKQTVKLGAKSASPLTYKSNSKLVTVNKKTGAVTIPAKFIGTATITISGNTANYNVKAKKVTVTVNPPALALSSVKAAKGKKMTITWKKNTAVDGYEIRYTTDKKLKKGFKTVKVKKSVTKTTISKLSKKKTYYVQIRTYKGKLPSAWSKEKHTTIKN